MELLLRVDITLEGENGPLLVCFFCFRLSLGNVLGVNLTCFDGTDHA
jgi:hypothetical protein